MSAPIFISYSSRDRQIAETICQALEARGQSCWIACRNVRAGENFQEAIVRALREAKVMLLVFSSNANNSEEIKKELVLAGRHHVTVVPARVEDVVPSDAFSYELATRQWVDLFKDWEREIEQLSAQLDQILNAEADGAARPPPPPASRPVIGPRPSNRPLILGLALAVLLLLAAVAALYLKPWEHAAPSAPAVPAPVAQAPMAPAPSVQTATQPPPATAPVAPAPAPERAPRPTAQRVTQSSPPPTAAAAAPAPVVAPPVAATPAPAPVANPDEAAWQGALSAGTREGFAGYVKNFPAGVHAQEAQLKIAELILSTPPTGASFDGTWQTTWTCPNLGQYPGYTYQFAGQFKDGNYHGVRGVKGEPSSMTLDGKIEADGVAAFTGEVIVGSSLVGLGAARGTPSDFHALAQFDRGSGTGRRLEGRACSLMFQKQ